MGGSTFWVEPAATDCAPDATERAHAIARLRSRLAAAGLDGCRLEAADLTFIRRSGRVEAGVSALERIRFAPRWRPTRSGRSIVAP
jgi:hypothetical protein